MPKLITKTKFDEIERLLSTSDCTVQEVAATAGVAGTCVGKIARGEHFYQCGSDERDRRGGNHGNTYLPTPVQIELECAKLRAARLPVDDGWTPPMVDASALRIA